MNGPRINPPEREIEDEDLADSGWDTWKEAEGLA